VSAVIDLTLEQARELVRQVEHKFGRKCQACEGTGVLFLGDPGAPDTQEVVCDSCDGRKWVLK